MKPNRIIPALNDIRLHGTEEKILFGMTSIIILAVGLTALIAPPNNWDSMAYHMSRVAHWIQNKSVAFYPTSISRQLWATPWSEYAICHLQILSLSDRFANLIQWFSMLSSILGCSLIAKSLGADRRGQLLTAVLCASIPVGILEASSTQNDYAAALWCICALYFGFQLTHKPGKLTSLYLALSVGLALSTKSTAILFLFPFLIYFYGAVIFKEPKKAMSVLILPVCFALLINGPQYIRNVQLAGNPFSLSSESKTVTNEKFNIEAVFSTSLRYLGLNLCTSHEQLNQTIAQTITRVHQTLGMNVTDPRYSSSGEYKIKQDIHEDNSCNSAYTVLLIMITALFFMKSNAASRRELLLYFSCLSGAFILFCLIVKWQPWGNRLLLPLIIMSVPFAATVLNRHGPRIQLIMAITFFLLCLPWILHNRSRPLMNKDFTIFTKDRNEQYFSNIPGEFFSYQKAAQEILQSGCRDIGLVMTTDSWEYPLWPLLGIPKNKNLRIEHVNVTNPSKQFPYPAGPFDPCMLVHDTAQGISSVRVNQMNFVKTNQFTFLSIYRKDQDGQLARSVLASNLQQMIRSAQESDQILIQAQTQGGIDQNTMLESLRLRKLSVDYAGLLDTDQLNATLNGLGTAVRDLYEKGTNLLLDGLTSQNAAKINEGQGLLNQWQDWLNHNANDIQQRLQ